MNTTTLTVYFEDPFWVGVCERQEDGELRVCKMTFGAEPRDFEVLDFVQRTLPALCFSPALAAQARPAVPDSPKRRQRQAQKLLSGSGVATRSQQALAAQRELQKTERRQRTREARELEAQRRFDLKQQKRREKKKGH